MNMILTAVLTVVLTLTGVAGLAIAGAVLVRRYLDGQKQQLLDILRSYFEAESPEKPSQFALLVDHAAQLFAKHAVDQAKGTLLGMQSGDSRLEKAMQADIVKDMATAESPILAGLMSAFPTLGRRLAKNPAALQILPSLLSKLGINTAGGRRAGGNGDRSLSDYGSQLKKY